MPKYVANVPLAHKGKYVAVEQEVELTEEQAQKLGDKVSPTPSTVLGEKNVAELKDLAKEKGIDGYYEMKKDELIQALEDAEK